MGKEFRQSYERHYDVRISVRQDRTVRFGFVRAGMNIADVARYVAITDVRTIKDRIYFVFAKEKEPGVKYYALTRAPKCDNKYFVMKNNDLADIYKDDWAGIYDIKLDYECALYYIEKTDRR